MFDRMRKCAPRVERKGEKQIHHKLASLPEGWRGGGTQKAVSPASHVPKQKVKPISLRKSPAKGTHVSYEQSRESSSKNESFLSGTRAAVDLKKA